jgi:phosphoribosylformylglycinamidine synthase
MGFERAGSELVLLGCLHDNLGGSEFARHFAVGDNDGAPALDFEHESALLKTLIKGFATGAISAAHDISHGGLLVALAEMMLGSEAYGLGCAIDLTDAGEQGTTAHVFSEYGGVIVEVAEARARDFEAALQDAGVRHRTIGRTTDDGCMSVRLPAETFELPLQEIVDAHKTQGRCGPLFSR